MDKPNISEEIAEALFDISKSLRLLGNGNIARRDTEYPGAIEGLAIQVRDSNEKIATSLSDVADAIRELAHAVEDRAK